MYMSFREFCEIAATAFAECFGWILVATVIGYFAFAACRELSYQGSRTVEANVQGQKDLIEYQLFLFQGAAKERGGSRDRDA